jgi:hypothetical protein
VLIEELGQPAPLWLYAGLTVVGFGFILAFVPETRGKSEAEISAFFMTSSQRARAVEAARRANAANDQIVMSDPKSC